VNAKHLAPDELRRRHLELLLSTLYVRDPLTREHRADLHKSGLSDETIERQCFRSIPPHMIDHLTGFPTPKVVSAYVLPFANPWTGAWLDHVRMKIFPAITSDDGTIKYLQPRHSAVQLYFPLATLEAVRAGAEPLYVVEGEKKSARVAELGRPAVGICGIEGWHAAGSRALLPDFEALELRGRRVELVPDGDVQTNPNVGRAAERLADALEARGATVRVVLLPVAA